jgi:hypothetical protein
VKFDQIHGKVLPEDAPRIPTGFGTHIEDLRPIENATSQQNELEQK